MKIKIILWKNQHTTEVEEDKTAKKIKTNLPLISGERKQKIVVSQEVAERVSRKREDPKLKCFVYQRVK